ncbi:MAG TPA: GNAT family N-acetyltransferase [Arenibaculum sp.]|nr:GNAT family N-acetyltransferase [Arenibaculum sp.]
MPRTDEEELTRDPGTTGFEHVLVRNLELSDLDTVVRIDARAGGRTRGAYYERKLAEAVRDSAIRISLAAEIDGIMAGFVIGRLYFGEFGMPEPAAIVDSIGVDPDFRGRKVGAALMAQLETNLKAVGIETIQTQVSWDQQDLLRFMHSEGFVPEPVLSLKKTLY